jgi:hypothetical protein
VWEVLDYGDVVVHLFTAEQREYYDLVRALRPRRTLPAAGAVRGVATGPCVLVSP